MGAEEEVRGLILTLEEALEEAELQAVKTKTCDLEQVQEIEATDSQHPSVAAVWRDTAEVSGQADILYPSRKVAALVIEDSVQPQAVGHALVLAAWGGYINCVRRLRELQKDSLSGSILVSRFNAFAFLKAAGNGHQEVIRELLRPMMSASTAMMGYVVATRWKDREPAAYPVRQAAREHPREGLARQAGLHQVHGHARGANLPRRRMGPPRHAGRARGAPRLHPRDVQHFPPVGRGGHLLRALSRRGVQGAPPATRPGEHHAGGLLPRHLGPEEKLRPRRQDHQRARQDGHPHVPARGGAQHEKLPRRHPVRALGPHPTRRPRLPPPRIRPSPLRGVSHQRPLGDAARSPAPHDARRARAPGRGALPPLQAAHPALRPTRQGEHPAHRLRRSAPELPPGGGGDQAREVQGGEFAVGYGVHGAFSESGIVGGDAHDERGDGGDDDELVVEHHREDREDGEDTGGHERGRRRHARDQWRDGGGGVCGGHVHHEEQGLAVRAAAAQGRARR